MTKDRDELVAEMVTDLALLRARLEVETRAAFRARLDAAEEKLRAAEERLERKAHAAEEQIELKLRALEEEIARLRRDEESRRQ